MLEPELRIVSNLEQRGWCVCGGGGGCKFSLPKLQKWQSFKAGAIHCLIQVAFKSGVPVH